MRLDENLLKKKTIQFYNSFIKYLSKSFNKKEFDDTVKFELYAKKAL